ncbi:hypothetical protein GGR55DRAFT_682183 [Xylaria sp. FL0064]|nr:hypothetical protein GGR55DRAFT_682183 [Xylaria sp. FL0064]
MSSLVKSERDLGERVREEVEGLALVRKRFEGYADFLEGNHTNERYRPSILSKLNDELDRLSKETQKCVELHAHLDALCIRVGQQERAMKEQVQKLSSIPPGMRVLEEQKHQLEEQSQMLAKELSRQDGRLTSQELQLADTHEKIDDIYKMTESIKLSVANPQELIGTGIEAVGELVKAGMESVNGTVKTEIESINGTVKTEIESTNGTVKTETESVATLLSSIQADVGKLANNFSSQQTILDKLQAIENHLQSSKTKGQSKAKGHEDDDDGNKTDAEIIAGLTNLGETSSELLTVPGERSYTPGFKRRRDSYDLLSDSEPIQTEDTSRDLNEWRRLFEPIRTVISISRPNIDDNDENINATMKKMRFMLLICLAYKTGGPDRLLGFIEDPRWRGEWVCVATLCERDEVFRPGDEECEDCKQIDGVRCLQIKKEGLRKIIFRMISWKESTTAHRESELQHHSSRDASEDDR